MEMGLEGRVGCQQAAGPWDTERGQSPPAVHSLLTITRGVLVEEEEMGRRRAASPAAETPALFPWTSTAVQDPGREGARRGGCLRA